MPILNLRDVSIDFPFEPYQCQLDYMSTFIDALQARSHALLESPTGTGKTLCLLCASLAWQESCKARIDLHRVQMRQQAASSASVDDLEGRLLKAVGADLENEALSTFAPSVPKVIFASRTHAQLSQAIQQLKQTAYRTCKVGIVGSRDQLCLHEEVRSLETNSAKVMHCRMRVKRRACEFYNNFDNTTKMAKGNVVTPAPGQTTSRGSDTILDIEELVSIGKERRSCPYYMARELKQSADLLFMPYNYLLDARIRRLHNIDLQNAVVIFDEAHNIEQVCEDSASVELATVDLAMAIEELRLVAQELHKGLTETSESAFAGGAADDALQPETHLSPILALKGHFLELEQVIDRLQFRSEEGLVRPGDYIFTLLAEANISHATYPGLRQLMDLLLRSVTNSNNYRLRQANGLSKVDTFLQAVFEEVGPPKVPEKRAAPVAAIIARERVFSQISTFYRVFVREMDQSRGGDKARGSLTKQRQLCYWCFSPGRAMSELLAHGVRSLILTSGTLYPLEAFKSGLGISFSGELRNPHVVERRQLWLGVLQRGPEGTRLNSSYESRDNPQYQAALGYAIANFARVIPNGLLVFFPSYSLMQKCLNCWKASDADIFNRIAQHKPILVEPRSKAEFQQAMEEYERKVSDPNLAGAIFMGVARGKVSEGMDFADHFGRAVIVTGLPYAPFMDPRVKLKMEYLDEARVQQSDGLTGRAWYRQDAWRAVNQAIGRVIRHRHDYGAVILCDERFGSADARAQLPEWMRGGLKVFGQFGACVRDLSQFYKATAEAFPSVMHSGKGKRREEPQARGVAPTKPGATAFLMSSAPQRSFNREVLAPSLRLSQPDSVETVQMSLDYATRAAPDSSSIGPSSGLMSILDQHERSLGRLSSGASKRSFSISGSQSSHDPLERRLEQLQKRRKLVVKATPSLLTPVGSHVDSKRYLERVKTVLEHDPNTLKVFNDCLQRYKRDSDLKALKSQLVQIFVFADAPDLARDFVVFVRAEHRDEFAAFCKEQLGMAPNAEAEEDEREEVTVGKENETPSAGKRSCIKCSCEWRDGLVLLAPPCRHICCFSCWRAIIEEGNRRCPRCHAMVRRRDLTRLKFSTE